MFVNEYDELVAWQNLALNVFRYHNLGRHLKVSPKEMRRNIRFERNLLDALKTKNSKKIKALILKGKMFGISIDELNDEKKWPGLIKQIEMLPIDSDLIAKNKPGPQRINYMAAFIIYELCILVKKLKQKDHLYNFLMINGQLDQYLKDNNLSRLGLPYPSCADSTWLRTYTQILKRRLMSEESDVIKKRKTVSDEDNLRKGLLSENVCKVLEAVEINSVRKTKT